MDLTTAAVDLLLGAACPGCGRAARALCASCATQIAPRPRVVRSRPVDVVASGEYADALRQTIVAWKEEGRSALMRPLAHLLASSVAAVSDGRALAIVPVPTSRRSRRARGADVVDELARCAASLLRATGAQASVHQALTMARRTVDQSGLGARDRARNLDGAFAVRSVRGLAGRDIVVVDDIVTTGATLGEAVRALASADHDVSAAATVAHRPLESPPASV